MGRKSLKQQKTNKAYNHSEYTLKEEVEEKKVITCYYKFPVVMLWGFQNIFLLHIDFSEVFLVRWFAAMSFV